MSEDRAVDGTPLWDGYTSNRDRDLRRHYAMKLAHYDRLLELQGGVCGMPGCTTAPKDGDPLQVDEDPVSRAIRGLLCRRHNRALDDRESEYMANPPAAPLHWIVPEKQWQTRAARNAGRARRHQEAKAAAKVEAATPARPLPPGLDRIRAMTQPDPAASPFREALARAGVPTAGPDEYQRALAESAAWSGGQVQARTDPPPGPPREAPPAEQGRGRSWLRRLLG